MAEQNVNVTTADDDEPLIKVPSGKRTFYFVILYGLFMMDFIARVGVNAIFPVVQADLGLTDGQIGSIASIVLLGMAVLVLPVSFIGEKKSPKKTITVLAFIWSIGSIFSGVASSFALLAGSRFLVGSGNSAYAPLSNSMITSMYRKAQWGKMIGIYNTAMTVGSAAGALIFAQLAAIFNWRVAFIAVGVVSLVFAVLSLTLPDTKEAMDKATTGEGKKVENKVTGKAAVAATLKNKALILTCLGGGLASLAGQGVNAYLSIYIVREMNLSLGFAAAFVGGTALISALAFPIGGTVMDKWYKKDKRARVWQPAICAIVCGILYVIGFKARMLVLLPIAGFAYAFGCTGFHTATQELVPAWFKSVSYGVYVIFIQFLGAVGPMIAGTISDATNLTTGLMALQIAQIGALLALVCAGACYLKYYNVARGEEQIAGCDACPE